MSETRYLYHYHAEYRGIPGSVSSIDGIASMMAPIQSMDDYHTLKSVVIRDLAPPIPIEQLIICSLTPLGETVVKDQHQE